jgi:secretion/DNA translocation related TadE-like protein
VAVLGLVLVLVAAAGLVATLGAVAVARHRAAAAADLAALAAAQHALEGAGPACAAARAVARAQAAELVSCAVDGPEAIVQARVRLGVLGAAAVQAKAGPLRAGRAHRPTRGPRLVSDPSRTVSTVDGSDAIVQSTIRFGRCRGATVRATAGPGRTWNATAAPGVRACAAGDLGTHPRKPRRGPGGAA